MEKNISKSGYVDIFDVGEQLLPPVESEVIRVINDESEEEQDDRESIFGATRATRNEGVVPNTTI